MTSPASAIRTLISDHAKATAIGAISRPAIRPTVLWLLAAAHSQAPQSRAASRPVTPSGPSGIGNSLALRPDATRAAQERPRMTVEAAAPAPSSALPAHVRGPSGLSCRQRRLAGEVLWLHRSLPSF